MSNATVSRIGQAAGSGSTSALFLKVFGKNYTSVFLSNNIFNLICILCIYKLCFV